MLPDAKLKQIAADIQPLRAAIITIMPDCLLYDAWAREDTNWVLEDAASYFGDLVRANRNGLKAIASWSAQMQVTIESSDSIVMIREITNDFVLSCVFDRTTPLGLIRLDMRRMIDRVAETLPKFEPEARPKGARIVEFLQRTAPDPHAVILRLSLRTGIPAEGFDRPEQLTEKETSAVEEAACEILGLQALNV